MALHVPCIATTGQKEHCISEKNGLYIPSIKVINNNNNNNNNNIQYKHKTYLILDRY